MPGEAVFVSVGGDGARAWKIEPTASGSRVPWDDDYWKPLEQLAIRHARWYLRDLPPRSGWTIRALEQNGVPTNIEGRSADLAVVVAMASYVAEVPLPDDVAFCAEIGTSGLLKPVDLMGKFECLERECPAIARIVVSNGQAVPSTKYTVERVASVQDAIALAFATTSLLSHVTATDVAARARVFRLNDAVRVPYGAHEGHLRALQDALGAVPLPSPRDLAELRYAVVVAGRHFDRCFPFPHATDLATLEEGSRTSIDRIAANRLQHATDFGISAESFADAAMDQGCFVRERVAETDALLANAGLSNEEAKKLGAFARFHAMLGDCDRAFRAAWKTVHYWSLHGPTGGEITRPLSELFRLASFSEVSRDALAYLEGEEADRIARKSSFVALSAFRWALLRRTVPLGTLETRFGLHRLPNESVPHVRGSYCRWLLWHPEVQRDAVLSALRELGRREETATQFVHLAALDLALRRADAAAAIAASEAMDTLGPRSRNLAAACPDDWVPPELFAMAAAIDDTQRRLAWVAVAYPY